MTIHTSVQLSLSKNGSVLVTQKNRLAMLI